MGEALICGLMQYEYLEDTSKAKFPGSKKPYPGLKDGQDRRDVISFVFPSIFQSLANMVKIHADASRQGSVLEILVEQNQPRLQFQISALRVSFMLSSQNLPPGLVIQGFNPLANQQHCLELLQYPINSLFAY